MNLENIMTKDIVIVDINDTINDIAILMRDFDIGFIPIAEDNKVIGVITDRDIVVNCLANKEEKNCEVGSYITRHVVNIDINDSIDDAIELMGNAKIKRLIVTDNDKVVGVISLSDLIDKEIEPKIIVDNLSKLFEISRNYDRVKPKVNEFYL